MEEDEDDDDPDGGMDGCDYCIGNKSLNPQLAWNAFYVDGNSLRNSWCLGKRCEDPDWEWYEEADKEQEDDIRDEQVTEQQEKVKRCEAATEELNKHSSEFSSASVAAPFSSSSKPTISCGISVTRPSTFWRPWEDPCEDKAGVGDVVTSQKSLVTPPQPYSSSAMIAATSPLLLTPQGRVFRKAKKRRSAGELVKRRQRLISFQLSHTPPSTPSKSEPDLSSLESGSWGDHPGGRSSQDLSSPGILLGQGSSMDNYSNQTNPHLLSYPSSPQSWWPSPGLVSSPSPAPSPPPAWLSSNMGPPSPAYCDGCQRWGNLLSVTVSQTRAH